MENTRESSLLELALPSWLEEARLKLTPKQQEVYPRFVAWLCIAKGTLAACLLDKSQQLGDPSNEMRDLADQLINAITGKDITSAFSILDRAVRLHNAGRRFQLPRPNLVARMPSAQSPFISKRWEHLNKVRKWQEFTFTEITRNQEPGHQAEHAYGRVLASAVLWGGLLSRRSLACFCMLLPNWRSHCSMEHGRLAIEWLEEGSNHKRWIADPLTALLLLRLSRAHTNETVTEQEAVAQKKAAGAEAGRALLSYFRSADLDRRQCPATLSELLDAVLLLLEMQVPRVLTQYAAGRHISHSLRPKAWARLMGRGSEQGRDEAASHAEQSGKPDERETEKQELGKEEDSIEIEEDGEPEWLRSLRETLVSEGSQGDKGRALGKVVAFLREPALEPEARIFAGFAEELLRQHASFRIGNTLKTLQARVVAVAKRLAGLLPLGDAASMNAETLQSAYQQVLEDACSDNQRQKLAGHLRAFHHYLVKRHLVGEIDEGEAFAIENEDLTIDANLILEDEYRQAAELLSDGQKSGGSKRPAEKALRQAAKLILMLGFRCGLRRMEVLKLQLTDLNEQNPAELLVRPWEQRRLKTPNATRKMPLHALLRGEELRELEEWKRRRQEESKDALHPSPFLFSVPGLNYLFVPEGMVFPMIHDALRSATGDRTLHFHHLRHSFASWLVFALMQPPNAPYPQWIEKWPGMREWIARSQQLHQSLYGNPFPTRRHLFALCRLLGHSTPAMSLEHYVHTFDQLLAQWLEKQMPRLEPKTWIAASGLPYQTAYRWLSIDAQGKTESGFWNLVERRWQRMQLEERREGDTPLPLIRVRPSKLLVEPSNHKEVLPIPDDLWLLLYLRAKEETSAGDLAHRFGLSEVLVKNLVEVAVEAERLKCGKRTHLHLFETAPTNKTARGSRALAVNSKFEPRPVKSARFACPSKPREQEDIRTVERFASRLWALIKRKPDLSGPVLNHFLRSSRNERNGLEFQVSSRKLAKRYLQLLRELGVSQEELIILRFGDENDAAAWGPWRKVLALQSTQTVKPAVLQVKGKALRNDIGIKVAISSQSGQKKASYGLRYLLVMAAIWVEAQARIASTQADDATIQIPYVFTEHP